MCVWVSACVSVWECVLPKRAFVASQWNLLSLSHSVATPENEEMVWIFFVECPIKFFRRGGGDGRGGGGRCRCWSRWWWCCCKHSMRLTMLSWLANISRPKFAYRSIYWPPSPTPLSRPATPGWERKRRNMVEILFNTQSPLFWPCCYRQNLPLCESSMLWNMTVCMWI